MKISYLAVEQSFPHIVLYTHNYNYSGNPLSYNNAGSIIPRETTVDVSSDDLFFPYISGYDIKHVSSTTQKVSLVVLVERSGGRHI